RRAVGQPLADQPGKRRVVARAAADDNRHRTLLTLGIANNPAWHLAHDVSIGADETRHHLFGKVGGIIKKPCHISALLLVSSSHRRHWTYGEYGLIPASELPTAA